jgi:endonuclease/exonuclease/phosphatase family metal-dependent hydrolase
MICLQLERYAVFLIALLSSGCAAASPGAPPRPEGSEFSVLTLNVHYVEPGQGSLDWDTRKDSVREVIREARPDVAAFQEMETFAGGSFNTVNLQKDWIRSGFPDLVPAAAGDPEVFPDTQPIFYRRDRFELLDQGFFFFSPTPDVLYSRSWDGRFPAFCSWVRLGDLRTGGAFYVFNLHLDHASRGNRLKAARLVADRIRNRVHPGDPVIVLGDFNAPVGSSTLRRIRAEGLERVPVRGSTFHFHRGIDVIPAIDHILHSPGLSVKGAAVLRDRYLGTWPSDHYPVLAVLDRADGVPAALSESMFGEIESRESQR